MSDHSIEAARAWLESIKEMLAYYDESGDQTEIHECALDITVRSGWVSLPSELEAEDYAILLSTGGPAVRIIGELRRGEPHTARLEHQDWFVPWTDLPLDGEDRAVVLRFAQQFYFVE